MGGGELERVVGNVRTGNGEKRECETLTMVVIVVGVQACKPDGGQGCIKCHPGGGS